MGIYAQKANRRAEKMLELLEVKPAPGVSPLVQLVEAVLIQEGNLLTGWVEKPQLDVVANRVVEREKIKVPLNRRNLPLWAARLAALVIAE